MEKANVKKIQKSNKVYIKFIHFLKCLIFIARTIIVLSLKKIWMCFELVINAIWILILERSAQHQLYFWDTPNLRLHGYISSFPPSLRNCLSWKPHANILSRIEKKCIHQTFYKGPNTRSWNHDLIIPSDRNHNLFLPF